MAIAHSANALGQAHDLVEHLQCVAKLAAEFAAKFGAGELAYWTELWHGLSEYSLRSRVTSREKADTTRMPKGHLAV